MIRIRKAENQVEKSMDNGMEASTWGYPAQHVSLIPFVSSMLLFLMDCSLPFRTPAAYLTPSPAHASLTCSPSASSRQSFLNLGPLGSFLGVREFPIQSVIAIPHHVKRQMHITSGSGFVNRRCGFGILLAQSLGLVRSV